MSFDSTVSLGLLDHELITERLDSIVDNRDRYEYRPPEVTNPMFSDSQRTSNLERESYNRSSLSRSEVVRNPLSSQGIDVVTSQNIATTVERKTDDGDADEEDIVNEPSLPTPMKRFVSDPVTPMEKKQAWSAIVTMKANELTMENNQSCTLSLDQNRLHGECVDSATEGSVAIDGSSSDLVVPEQTRNNHDSAVHSVHGGGGRLYQPANTVTNARINKVGGSAYDSITAIRPASTSFSEGGTILSSWGAGASPQRHGHPNAVSGPPQDLDSLLHWLRFAVPSAQTGGSNGECAVGEPDIETGRGYVDIVETFYCGICLENCAKYDSFSASACSLHHTYCVPCLASYTAIQVTDGVVDHYCPGVGECNAAFSMEELSTFMRPEDFTRLQRMTLVKKNPLYRECPLCRTGCEATSSTNAKGELVPVASMRCSSCNHVFCFFHDNAHPGITCKVYARQQSRRARQEQQASQALVKAISKQCPSCHAATEKNGGCNHMTCQHCHANWCWLCSSVLADVTEHYRQNNIWGCPGAQFIEAPLRPNPFSGLCRMVSCCLVMSCWNSRICIAFNNTLVSIRLFVHRVVRMLLLLLIIPPTALIGLAFMCGCSPIVMGILLTFRRDRLRWRAFKDDCSTPGVGGAVLFLVLLDLVYVPPLLMWFCFSYLLTRIRFGAETTALIYADEYGSPRKCCSMLADYIESVSITVWIVKFIDG